MKGEPITKMQSKSFFPDLLGFLSIIPFFPFLPWFPSNRDDFALNGIVHNYFSWVLIMEKNTSGRKSIIINYVTLPIQAAPHSVCFPIDNLGGIFAFFGVCR